MKNRKHKYLIISVIMILTAFVVATVIGNKNSEAPDWESGTLAVHFIDVGQGDCSYIEFPDGKTMLIDAGEAEKGEKVAEYIKGRGAERIDFVIGTHPHSDHIGGLAQIITGFEIGEIYMPKVSHNTKAFEDVLLAVKNKNKTISSPMAGDVIHQSKNLSVTVLSPAQKEYDSLNNYSFIVKVVYKDKSFLFTGDAENEVLTTIKQDVNSDVLKVAHHGSSTSDDEEFMKRVSPEYAVISVGEGNRYGHPHREVKGLLESVNAKVYRTDQDGTIIFSTDGEDLDIITLGDEE